MNRLTAMLGALLSAVTLAGEPAACRQVRFADAGWTDSSATTAVAALVLEGLGYRTRTDFLSVPVTYRGLAAGKVDVFLGNWMPSMRADVAPYAGRVDTVRANLVGTRYTLAVPDYVWRAGVRSFADLAREGGRFGYRVYGIEPGNQANQTLQAMMDRNDAGLGRFKLVESSEAGMLAQVKRAVARGQWIAFLAWAPHPMNRHLALRYLDGGDAWFGRDYGGGSVYTNTRAGYSRACPNVGRFLAQLSFSVDEENALMDDMLGHGLSPREAARRWLVANPGRVRQWLDGVAAVGEEG